MKTKLFWLCFISLALGLSSCDLNSEPKVEPSITVDSLLIKKLGMDSDYMDVYNLFGSATLKPEGKQVIEAGFMFSSYSRLDASSVKTGDTGKKVQCEIRDNRISFDVEESERKNYVDDITYCLAYMILSGGQVVVSPTYKVSIYDVVGDYIITTGNAENIGYNDATLIGQLELTGNATLHDYGFYYGTVTNPEGKVSVSNWFTGSKLDYSITVRNLKPNTKYYVRAYGVDIQGKVIKGEERSFTTRAMPSVTINEMKLTFLGTDNSYRDKYNIKGTATLLPEGYEVAEAGFVYSAYYGIGASDVSMPGTAKKIACEIVNNRISIDKDVVDSSNFYGGGTYILAYMILKDGTIFVSPTQRISRYD